MLTIPATLNISTNDPVELKRLLQLMYDDLYRAVSEKHSFIDRGDPAAVDFTQANLTTDGNWKTGANALDFSAIVPEGAKAMLLRVAVNDNAVATQLVFRKSGQSNTVNCGQIFTQVSGVWIVNDSMILPCSADRKVEYVGTNTTIDSVLINVKGWWI